MVLEPPWATLQARPARFLSTGGRLFRLVRLYWVHSSPTPQGPSEARTSELFERAKAKSEPRRRGEDGSLSLYWGSTLQARPARFLALLGVARRRSGSSGSTGAGSTGGRL
jgi:hypothetical protein